MLAAVGLYALVLGALFATVDALVDRAATLGRRPRRWIWVAALTASLGLTAAAPWRSTDAPDTGAASLGVTLAVGATESTNAVTAPRASWANVGVALRARVDAFTTATTKLDPLLARLWIASSAVLTALMLVGAMTLARQRRQWREAIVSGEPALLSPTTGPAVVGLLSPRIVLPGCALGLDAASLDLILRHEREHVRAHDQWLMRVAVLAVTVMPWNPLVWWMASRLRLAVELDYDARVLGARGFADGRGGVRRTPAARSRTPSATRPARLARARRRPVEPRNPHLGPVSGRRALRAHQGHLSHHRGTGLRNRGADPAAAATAACRSADDDRPTTRHRWALAM